MTNYTTANYEDIKVVMDSLVDWWGEDGKKVIALCLYEKPFNNTFDEFLKHCYACGGNWGGMLLTGIKALYPAVWEAIPDNMGVNAFAAITNLLILLGVYTICEEE